MHFLHQLQVGNANSLICELPFIRTKFKALSSFICWSLFQSGSIATKSMAAFVLQCSTFFAEIGEIDGSASTELTTQSKSTREGQRWEGAGPQHAPRRHCYTQYDEEGAPSMKSYIHTCALRMVKATLGQSRSLVHCRVV